MDEHKYLEKMQKIQQNLIEFIEEESSSEEDLSRFNFFIDIPNEEIQVILKEFLLIISQISRYHYRTTFFHSKIEHILTFYKDLIKRNLSNKEIFNIFKCSKRILLFLFKEQIIKIDNSICNILSKYEDYFSKEIGTFKENENKEKEEIERKRLIGENDNLICHIIRNDSIEEFVKYVHQANIPLRSQIPRSIYETNSLLLEKEATLIEYSAFFGSLQIFQYLIINKIEVTAFACKCVIHSKNAELIKLIEENKNIPEDFSYVDCIVESIKCHHNEIANYFKDYFLSSPIDYFDKIIPSYNYLYFKGSDFKRSENVVKLIKYNYVSIVKYCLKDYKEDVNSYLSNFKHEDAKFYLSELNSIDLKQYLPKDREYICKFDDDRFSKVNCTFLTIAISNENVEIVDYLIRCKNAQVNIKYSIGDFFDIRLSESMLYLAVEVGNKEIVDLLLHNDKCFATQFPYLTIPNETKDFLIIVYYEEIDPITTENNIYLAAYENKTVLTKAIENNDKEIVELLLNYNEIDVNKIVLSETTYRQKEDYAYAICYEKKNALSIAVEKGNKEIVELLLKKDNIDVNLILSTMYNKDFRKFRESGNDYCHYDFEKCNEEDYAEKLSSIDMAKKNGNNEIYQLLLQRSKNKI